MELEDRKDGSADRNNDIHCQPSFDKFYNGMDKVIGVYSVRDH